jgi:hypothetical protein
MESPFYPNGNGNGNANANTTFSLFLEPVLDPYSQTYINIITLSYMPAGPLQSLVKMVSFPKLSPFATNNQNKNTNTNGLQCSYVLLRYPTGNGNGNYKCDDIYMYSNDIPAVFSYLRSHGYTIDTSCTKMMNGSRISWGFSDNMFSGDKRLICFVFYG